MTQFEALSFRLQERLDVLVRRLMWATHTQNLCWLHLLGRLLPDVVAGFNEADATVFKEATHCFLNHGVLACAGRLFQTLQTDTEQTKDERNPLKGVSLRKLLLYKRILVSISEGGQGTQGNVVLIFRGFYLEILFLTPRTSPLFLFFPSQAWLCIHGLGSETF